MQSMKKIPFKIFITILIAGIIGILGEIILKYHMDKLLDNYEEIIYEHTVNRDYMNDIRVMLYEHQALVAHHVMAVEESQMKEYEQREEEISVKLSNTFSEFGKRMNTDEREQLYHKVYSNYYSYLNNARVAIALSEEGKDATARYYLTGSMADFVEKVNSDLDNLDVLSVNEMNEAKTRMEYYISISALSQFICILGIAIATVVSVVYCYRIAKSLDRYKDNLEKEVEKKTKTIRENSERMISYQNSTIIGMANLIESRDGNTGEHVKRTSYYVELLAKEAKHRGLYSDILTDDYIELLVKATPLHDIGKIVVSDKILQKPGKLTPQEYEIIKLHAKEGGKVIQNVIGDIDENEYVAMASDVATYHHEKWDGSGYNEGLKGEDIPLCARIMALADVFDALVSKRVYKEAMPVDEAFKIIQESSGTHFDPKLAEVFLDLRPEIEACFFENMQNVAQA